MLDGNVDHACQLGWKTVKLHSFWCSFYSLNKLLLMAIKNSFPFCHPCSLPGNKSDVSSSQPCRKEIISKIQPWCHFAVRTDSRLTEPVPLVKSKFLVWEEGHCTSETRPWKGLTSVDRLRLPYFSQGFLLEAERWFWSSLAPLNVSVLLHRTTALWLTPLIA